MHVYNVIVTKLYILTENLKMIIMAIYESVIANVDVM